MPRNKRPVVLTKLPTQGWTAPITPSLVESSLIERDRDGVPLYGEVSITDKRLNGFTLRVRAVVAKGEHTGRARWNEVKSFLFRWHNGKLPLGLASKETLPEAKRRAQEARTALDNGEDPRTPRKLAKEIPLLTEQVDKWLDIKRSKKRASSTLSQYARCMKAWVKRLGNRKLNAIALVDVEDMHLAMEANPVEADHMVRTLRAFLYWAAGRWKLPENPCKDFELYGDQERERAITLNELRALTEVSNKLLDVDKIGLQAHHLFWLLLVTGARQIQVYGLRWDQVDFERKLIFFRPKDPKGKRKTRRRADIRPMTHLSEALLKDLKLYQEEQLKQKNSDFVFPGRDGARSATRNIFIRQWQLIRATAGAREVWLNDLRHHWGTLAAELQLSPLVTMRLMGHERVTTTQRYMAFRYEALRSGADTVTAELLQRAGTLPSLVKPPVSLPLQRLWSVCRIPGEPTEHPSADQLGAIVESLPLREVAEFFGMSDRGMAKRCKAEGVKTNPRGYWLQGEPARRAAEYRAALAKEMERQDPPTMDGTLRQSLASALLLAGIPWSPEDLFNAARACADGGRDPLAALRAIAG